MKSKSLIEKQTKRKTNPELVETISKAKKAEKWLQVAGILSMPRNKKIAVNLDKIDKEAKEGDTIIVPGKVLSSGNISKKLRIAAMGFSEEAEKKLKEKKCGAVSLKKEIELNPRAEGIKLVK